MTRFQTRPTPIVNIVLAVTTVLVVMVDLNTPLGISVWVFYAAPVVVSFFAWRPELPLVTAAAATLLTMVGYLASPPGGVSSYALLNRTFGVAAVWVLAVLGWRFILAKLAVARQEWLGAGENELTSAMRGDLSEAQIGHAVMRSLAHRLDAGVAAFYSKRGDAFVRVASWAGG